MEWAAIPKGFSCRQGFCSQFYYLNFSTQLIKDLSQQCSSYVINLLSSHYLEVDIFPLNAVDIFRGRILSALLLHLWILSPCCSFPWLRHFYLDVADMYFFILSLLSPLLIQNVFVFLDILRTKVTALMFSK